MPVSKIGKSLRIVATSNELLEAPCARPAIAISVGDLDIDLVALHRYGVGLGGDHGRQAGHFPGYEVEARAMLRAFDVHAPQLTFAEIELLVGTDVVERVKVAVLRVRQTDRRAARVDPLDAFVRKLTDGSDAEPS